MGLLALVTMVAKSFANGWPHRGPLSPYMQVSTEPRHIVLNALSSIPSDRSVQRPTVSEA